MTFSEEAAEAVSSITHLQGVLCSANSSVKAGYSKKSGKTQRTTAEELVRVRFNSVRLSCLKKEKKYYLRNLEIQRNVTFNPCTLEQIQQMALAAGWLW